MDTKNKKEIKSSFTVYLAREFLNPDSGTNELFEAIKEVAVFKNRLNNVTKYINELILKDFSEQGLIKLENGHRVLDKAKLQEIKTINDKIPYHQKENKFNKKPQ